MKKIIKNELKRIHDSLDPRMKMVMTIYRNSFPTNERQLDETIFHRHKLGINEIYVLEDSSHEILGMAMLFPLQESDFTLLDYFAISQNNRNSGYGSILFQFIKKLIFEQKRKLILEVEKPINNDASNEQVRRIKFYKKNGAIPLENVPYILPSIAEKMPVEMLLFICTERVEQLNHKTISDLISNLYQQVYQKKANDELLVNLLNKLPEKVTLNF
jgi:GNAT superfamily N-acetyltransferase